MTAGDALSLHVKQVQVAALKSMSPCWSRCWIEDTDTRGAAFAAILGEGAVVAWGHAMCGGNSENVQDKLSDVQQQHGSSGSFAALLRIGSVVTWGDVQTGGDSSRVQLQLKQVRRFLGMDLW